MDKKKLQGKSPSAWLDSQLHAANALIKFCDDHNYTDKRLCHLKACQQALDAGEINMALVEYQKIPLGGNGCFNDWWPNAVFEHETEEYTGAVFQALIERWSRLMQLSIQTKDS